MVEKDLDKIIAYNISQYLLKTNSTQEELAEYMGVSQATVSHWCRGSKLPRMNKIDRICDFFSINRSQLLDASEASGFEITPPLTEDEKHVIRRYRQLSPSRKADIKLMMDSFIAQSDASSSSSG